ncbi:type I secretion membrane fusion protein, HlyD family (plasmid) [Afipia carboxidovorans OM5]|uniref:Membrane fusion protein (MFP) family protein n=1 Tax=Afipia carboxidovorans (strain ATCC 49405 / DSM 1227 / KCTC 32145 / OM5) TaxID=504832 RepID=F8C0Y8_AFIC5|nr:HlyD family type I secretion periplasmic adaptor subunit [Afipia carboxidovorans]AEI04470.1 type I secretion membrane fusion protein, HlyD family [Afipia carboxidovorans OM4]AEI08098.1 type I secretion membrane fusion protein, HlyD family [Afipia carboxidovorans OM5]
MTESTQRLLRRSMQRHVLFGTTIIAFLVVGAGGWATTTELAGAVIATGTVVVEGNVKVVQHPTGGVVADLRVREGQMVEAGEVVIRLDETTLRANLMVVSKGINQILARKARLLAEQENLEDVPISSDLAARVTPDEAKTVTANEIRLFRDRRLSREGQKDQLRERIQQLQEQISGYKAQQGAKTDEIALIEKELEGVRYLYENGLTPISRLHNLERSSARLRGERGQLIASIAAAKGKIAETELELIQIDQNLRSEVATELRDLNVREGELIEREVAARDQLERVDIRAPIAGIVHQLAMHTVGGVVRPGEVLLQVVPIKRELDIEARIRAQDIDRIALGHEAVLRFVAFNRNSTPELIGAVTKVSADAIADSQTSTSFYKTIITLSADEARRLGRRTLVPGMPVDCYIRTSDRTVLSYLVKPLVDHATRAFRYD